MTRHEKHHLPSARNWSNGAACLLVLACCAHAAAGLPVLDSVMDRDPLLPVQPVELRLPAEWRALWQQALEGPEEDLRREAAEAIIRAQQSGCSGLEELGSSLRSALAASKNPTVRLSLATALIELDVLDAVAELAALVESGGDRESLVIEPALARWRQAPLRDVWLARLAAPQSTSRRRLLLAIAGVHVLGESRAESPLRKLALDRAEPAATRLAAAAALGAVHSTDLIDDARQLAAETSPRGIVDRLAAVHMPAAIARTGAAMPRNWPSIRNQPWQRQRSTSC
jgi:hypothetical protein